LIHSQQYKQLNISPPKGILLYGKSGTGKTSIARAIANEINANFVSVECTELISKYVGESSKSISNLFQKARSCSPCVLFFDQFEAIARKRGNDSSESQSNDRMLSTLLIEMDGISSSSSDQLIILAATSRIDLLDVAGI
jgi:SpoVK/Ycf46/Vps4 family AAA+-type ATPase